jgi:hypothetical protein
MPAVGDIFEVVDVSTLDGQEVLNVYFYKRTAEVLVGNVAQQVADTFATNVLSPICQIQTPDILHTEIRVRNLFYEPDTYVKVISEPGTNTLSSNSEAAFNAIGFKLTQDNGAIRNGAKRYGGVPSTVFNDGVVTDADMIGYLVALGAELILGQPLGIVAGAIAPVIVKRILDGGSYRLPTNSGEAVTGNLTEAQYNANETSQTSRKIGNGV